MYHNQRKLILASGSPRRQKYLKDMGLDFIVRTASVHEQPLENEKSESFVLRMAREKAAAVSVDFPDFWVVSGDTVVCLGDQILGKPSNEEHAVALLMALSGREHCVKTGFCVAQYSSRVEIAQFVTTKVYFSKFSESVARAYVATGEPLDKAGAYGIQGKGACLVKAIEGSYSNVVGLPLFELMEILLENGVVEPNILIS